MRAQTPTETRHQHEEEEEALEVAEAQHVVDVAQVRAGVVVPEAEIIMDPGTRMPRTPRKATIRRL